MRNRHRVKVGVEIYRGTRTIEKTYLKPQSFLQKVAVCDTKMVPINSRMIVWWLSGPRIRASNIQKARIPRTPIVIPPFEAGCDAPALTYNTNMPAVQHVLRNSIRPAPIEIAECFSRQTPRRANEQAGKHRENCGETERPPAPEAVAGHRTDR